LRARGQISSELIASVIIIFLLFVVVFAYVSQRNQESVQLRDFYSRKNTCNLVANQISYIYSTTKNSESIFFIDMDVNVFGSYIEAGPITCYFQGTANPASLHIGNVILRNNKGVVSLENE